MSATWRILSALIIGITVGLITAHLVAAHSHSGGAYQLQVRLGSAMAGLFAAGIVTTLIAITLLRRTASSSADPDINPS